MAFRGPLGRGEVQQLKACQGLLQSNLETKGADQVKGQERDIGQRSSTCTELGVFRKPRRVNWR